ncbi:hypothetical protein, partial [Cryobacterium sp. MLB-32]
LPLFVTCTLTLAYGISASDRGDSAQGLAVYIYATATATLVAVILTAITMLVLKSRSAAPSSA